MEMKKYIEPSVRVKDVETESLLELASKPPGRGGNRAGTFSSAEFLGNRR